MKTFKYGGDSTIHSNNGLDVEVDKHGEVVAVWFRCMMIPFKQVHVDEDRAKSMRKTKDLHGVDAIDFIEKDRNRDDGDWQPLIVTQDYKKKRINIAEASGKVHGIVRLG